jgi:hypothetical protein
MSSGFNLCTVCVPRVFSLTSFWFSRRAAYSAYRDLAQKLEARDDADDRDSISLLLAASIREPSPRVSRRRGVLGLAVIGVGVAVVGLNIRPSLDPVIVSLTRNHGIHLSDPVGAAIVYLGALLIWIRR